LRFKEQGQAKFDPKCFDMLTTRTQLFAKASQVCFLFDRVISGVNQLTPIYILQVMHLESVNDLVEQLSNSPAKHVFLTVGLSFIGLILLLGVLCGRISKRHQVMKNR